MQLTVQSLIDELTKIENKELPVVVYNDSSTSPDSPAWFVSVVKDEWADKPLRVMIH